MANKDVLTSNDTAPIESEIGKELLKVAKDCANALAHDGVIDPKEVILFTSILGENIVKRFRDGFSAERTGKIVGFEVIPTIVAETLVTFLMETKNRQ